MAKPIKLLLNGGLAALCEHIKKIKSTADTSASAVLTLSQATADTFEEVENALAEKQDIAAATAFSIPVAGWKSDNSIEQFPYCCEIAVEGLTDTDIVSVVVKPESLAQAAGFMPLTESLDGKFRLRATSIPTADIEAQYHITSTATGKGKS